MGAANSTQHRETRHALKEKVKEVAQIALLLEEVTFARSLESLIESPSFFEDTVVLNFRNDLIKASNRDDPKPKPPPPRGDLSRYFQQFEIRKAQLCQLVSLANVWKLQQKDTVRYIEQEASHWQKDHSLFWGRYLQPSTGLAGLKRLVREIEQTEKLSAIRRRLLLVIVHRAVNAETDRLSAKVKRSRGIKTKLTTIKTKLSQYREDQHPDNRVRQRTTKEKRRLTDKISEFQSKETKLTKEQQELHKEIKSYPEGKSRRQQAIRKLHKDVWAADILSEEEFKREEDKFMDYARWGKKYDKLEPLGILFFLGNTHHLWYEREKWYPAAYDAMRSYWQDLSGIGPLCHFYTPLVTALIQTYWNPLSAGRTVQEADTGRSSPGSIPVGSHGGASPEGKAPSYSME
ncbi:hypothetical protein FGG08_003128 [Glutinoglossum americanum]|uniref:Uncharacterized protein n=1 Tax=Glutinoglossum americanum TaxID=1670608 RepID=A0A9P8IBL7_9PEZI|nr:hypothetical protein FGG08_003128 [Glutinoglossum americanum]